MLLICGGILTIGHYALFYWLWMLVCILASLILANLFVKSMVGLLDLATIMAFIAAPLFSFMNYRVVMNKQLMPAEATPPIWLHILSIIGLAFLTLLALVWIASKFSIM